MNSTLPCYELIKALKKAGFHKAEDRAWIESQVSITGRAFEKEICQCVEDIEVILKPYSYSIQKKTHTYYIGQCPSCEKIYYASS